MLFLLLVSWQLAFQNSFDFCYESIVRNSCSVFIAFDNIWFHAQPLSQVGLIPALGLPALLDGHLEVVVHVVDCVTPGYLS
jgi:hypothetical protein